MNSALVWIRLLLTLFVFGFPVYTFGAQIRAFFLRCRTFIRSQFAIAQARIEANPQIEDPDEIFEPDLPPPPVEGTSKSPLPKPEEDDPERREIQELNNTSTTPSPQGTQSTDSPSDTLDLSEQISMHPKAQSTTFTAEQLAQTIDDIKYAALTYKERGKKDDYEKKLVEGIALVGDHEEFLVMLADHYFEAGQYVKASTLLKKITTMSPENHRAIRQLGQIYINDGDIETGKLLLEKALSLKQDNPKYLIALVEVYYNEKNLRECVTLVERLSKLRPTNIDYLLTLGQLHEELKQPTKAHSYFMKVLELNPLNDEAKRAIKRLL